VSDPNFLHCEAMVREQDPDRYFATLFAPARHRPHLFALHAFNSEVARIRDAITQTLAGEIRLQWWRDVIGGSQGAHVGEASANPVAAALETTITQYTLPRQPLLDLIEARTHDLYDDPMATLNDLEGYCGETVSALFRLSALILADGEDPGAADAAGYAGVAYGVTGLMRAFPFHVRRGQLYLPPVEVLERHGLTRGDVVAGRADAARLAAALTEMRSHARRRLGEAETALRNADPRIGAGFLPLAFVPLYLDAMEVREYAPYESLIEVARWRKLWRLWRRARRGWRA
jgi:phytoene synthase